VLMVGVLQLQPQHRTDPDLQFIDNIKSRHPCRGSGLVLRPKAAVRLI
jgi:hypothetical protein